MQFDLAETDNIQELIAQIGGGLDQFLKFEHPDAWHPEANWRQYLDVPLPQHGVGIHQVVEDLLHQVIPNGSAVPKPGFTSFITTGATTASVLASTAASIAAPQRYHLNAFNLLEDVSLRWLASMCHIGHMQGVYSSGGSVANLLALGAARQFAFEKLGHDAGADGVPNLFMFTRAPSRTIRFNDPPAYSVSAAAPPKSSSVTTKAGCGWRRCGPLSKKTAVPELCQWRLWLLLAQRILVRLIH